MLLLIVILMLVTSAGLLAEQKKSDNPYSSAFAFSKALNKKMKYYYNWHMVWLKVYMNIALPCLILRGGWDIFTKLSVGITALILVEMAAFLLLIFDFLQLRAIDSFSYWVNVVTNIGFLIASCAPYLLTDNSVTLTESFAMNNSSIMGGFFVLTAVIWGIIVICNLAYFHRRRELFFKSAKQLKILYGNEDADRPL